MVTLYTTLYYPPIYSKRDLYLLTPRSPSVLISDLNMFKDPKDSTLQVYMTCVSWHACGAPEDVYLNSYSSPPGTVVALGFYSRSKTPGQLTNPSRCYSIFVRHPDVNVTEMLRPISSSRHGSSRLLLHQI